jgi:seryl-tRNA synthetase
MSKLTGVDGAPALALLGPAETRLVRALDQTFTSWAADADEINAPPLYPVTDLEKFDVYTNFPHLSLVAGSLKHCDDCKPVYGRFAPADLLDAPYGLPHAACYGVYLFHEGDLVDDGTVMTLVNRCFRNEEHYSGLCRLASFQMREIVALGAFQHTQDVLARFTAKIEAFAAALGLTLDRTAAVDPFYTTDGARALLQKLKPLKYEFVHDGLAIASVNTHRNFFGERCDIRLHGTGEHAFTSCVAFGLERWLAVLANLHDDDLDAAHASVAAAGKL